VASSSSSMIVTGTVVGSSGAYGGSGNTRDKVFDGNIGTFFDAVNPSGDWAGLDLGSSETITMVKYCPRAGWASRMVGGMFQGSNNASFSSGVVTLFTIGVSPAEGVLTQQVISNPGAYRYVRYIGPNGGYCNVAEVEFHTAAEADTTAPAVPTGLTATGGDAKVSLDWDDNGDPDLAGYIVYRSNTSGGGYAMIASGLVASAYTDNSAANGSTYYYRVSPKDYSSNESAAGVEVSATASDVTAPLAPTGLMAVFIDGTVSLNWDDNLEHDLAGYTVYRSTTSGGGYAAIASNLTTSAYVDDSTDSETTYFYVVTARDLENNESANSAQVSVTTPEVDGVVSFSTDVPAVGDGVQNLDTSTNDATNTQHQYVPSDYIGTEYRGDNLQMAQSFTTGSNAAAFALNAVSVRQVGWGPTDWDYDGGSITVRIFDLSAAGPGSVWYATEMASRTVFLHGTGTPVVNGTPSAPKWLTFTFSDPVLLAPDRMYAFAIGATGGVSNQEFFMNLDGTATDSYADGFSLSVPDDSAAMWDGGNGRPSDRTFVAAMTAVSYQVPLVNPGFEQPAAGKISNGFDGTTDVPGWSDYGAMTDSGIESPAFVAHSGDYAAYLKAGDGGAWQMTGYTIQEGDVITVGYWARIDWADSPCDATVVVFRDTPDSPEHVIGSSPAALTGTWTYFEYTVTATAASAGQELGIEFKNTQTDWAAIDDVTLTVDRVAAPPAAPTGLAATAGDGSVDLDWDDNSEPNFASYKVYRSSTSGSGYAEIATGLTASVYTDATAVSGTTYHYAVSAVDSAMNESPLSSEASATPMTPAQSWRMAHFETLDNTGDAADGADPEKDGISNLLERAFGGDPNEPDTQILPRVDPTMPALSMIYQFSLDATDLTIFVQENAVLQGAWSPAAGSSGIIGVSGGIRTMRFTRPMGDDTATFLRIGVESE
ncbi:MAG: hypothetical protein KDN05_09570, partial [Verrucomicrobiae bacterium]|nr:hypothetical protein [Verrucomicrobiae bacterium]